jgi:hypothetical protein
LSSASFSRTLRSTTRPSGIEIAERSRAMPMLRTIERPDEGDLAAVVVCGVEDLLDAVHVAGKLDTMIRRERSGRLPRSPESDRVRLW